ncbi:MAG: hypothetical protein U9O94_06210 [Nanoarchaeota archaeon]|nr:hypothetical protein [Nanoarchaeota archaeon]
MTKYTLEIKPCECFESPREWDNLGTVVASHGKYSMSDEGESNPYWGEIGSMIQDFIAYIYNRDCYGAYPSCDELDNENVMERFVDNNYIYLPIYMYEHSSIALNTTGFSCKWDSGLLGYIYVSKKKIREWFSIKNITKKIRKQVLIQLVHEIEAYSNYCNGELYRYIVKDETGEVIDDCGGFFTEENAESEGKRCIQYCIEHAL